MTKDQLRDVNFVFLVHLNRNSFSIIPDTHEASFRVDFNLDDVHPLVPLVVVSSIDKHFVKDLVECRNILDSFIGKLQTSLSKYPFVRFLHLDASHISIWPYEDVFERSFLLVNFFNSFFPH